MEGLGQKLRKAREARNLTLEEAARMTKIRPNKLAEIEAEDFSNFPSLAYARGFLVIYGKFLDVDVSPYLEAFETSEHVTVDGYSYLQDNPAPPPRRTEIIPRETRQRSSLMPLVIGLVVMIGGFAAIRLLLDVKRIAPAAAPAAGPALVTQLPPQPPADAAPGAVAQPQPQPQSQAQAPTVAPTVAAAQPAPPAIPNTGVATPAPTPAEVAAVATPDTTAAAVPEGEEEVRRAEPVNPEDLKRAEAALANPAPSPSPVANRWEIRPLRKTYVKVVADGAGRPSVDRWLTTSDGMVQVRGRRISVKLLDPTAVEILKNGRPVTRGDADITLE